jgi:hypothetical protein
MPFRLLNPPQKDEEKTRLSEPDVTVQSPPVAAPVGKCTVDLEVDVKSKTYRMVPHEGCDSEIDKLNELPLLTRRGVANRMQTSDPELERRLAEVKRRKSPTV